MPSFSESLNKPPRTVAHAREHRTLRQREPIHSPGAILLFFRSRLRQLNLVQHGVHAGDVAHVTVVIGHSGSEADVLVAQLSSFFASYHRPR